MEKIKEWNKYDFECKYGFEEMKALAPFIGLPISTRLMIDKGSPTILLGLKIRDDYYGWSGLVRFWVNGYMSEKWIQTTLLKPL